MIVDLGTAALPPTAPCDWSGEAIPLRYALPRIWTQKQGRPFGIYWSAKTGYGRLWPQPTDDEWSSFYNTEWYDDYMRGKRSGGGDATRTLLERIAVKIAWLADRSAGDPAATILELRPQPALCDLGCGSGAFLGRVKANARRVVGVDPSKVSGGTVASLGIEFHLGTAEALPPSLAVQKFDVVTMFQSLEHCRDPFRALANAASILEKDGLIVVDVPNHDCLGFEVYGPAWYHTDAGRHLHFFTARSLAQLLADSGFTPIRTEYHSFVRQFTPEWLVSMQMVWDSLFRETDGGGKRPTRTGSLQHLARAIFSGPERKYDLFRIYATLAR